MDSPFSKNACLITGANDHCVLSHEALDISEVLAIIASAEAGAIATFIGQTRNNFNGNLMSMF
jgi:molybdopterin synthase catalytic subunit